jgi:hypothetical protein
VSKSSSTCRRSSHGRKRGQGIDLPTNLWNCRGFGSAFLRRLSLYFRVKSLSFKHRTGELHLTHVPSGCEFSVDVVPIFINSRGERVMLHKIPDYEHLSGVAKREAEERARFFEVAGPPRPSAELGGLCPPYGVDAVLALKAINNAWGYHAKGYQIEHFVQEDLKANKPSPHEPVEACVRWILTRFGREFAVSMTCSEDMRALAGVVESIMRSLAEGA